MVFKVYIVGVESVVGSGVDLWSCMIRKEGECIEIYMARNVTYEGLMVDMVMREECDECLQYKGMSGSVGLGSMAEDYLKP
jgi:hypothetical protein